MEKSPQPPGRPARRILILFAHPALEKSRVNRALADAVQDLPGVTFHDLYEAYPRFDIDIKREQGLLLRHDLIVLQHPFFWYSTPALLKEWQDLVLQHEFAYGARGTALHGKLALTAVTTGGGAPAYCAAGRNHFTMRQLLAPLEQTFRLCGVRYLSPFIVHGTLGLDAAGIDRHAAAYRTVLEGLRDDRVDLDAADRLPKINEDLDRVLTS